MSSYSPFTVTSRDAAQIVQGQTNREDNRRCFMLQVKLQVVYGGGSLPQSAYKKLPRLVNGIPLGAGRLSQTQEDDIHWKYVEDNKETQTFISVPLLLEEADEARSALRERLITQAKAVFGDITVKASISLSQCLCYDSEIFINDIAESTDAGLQFHD